MRAGLYGAFQSAVYSLELTTTVIDRHSRVDKYRSDLQQRTGYLPGRKRRSPSIRRLACNMYQFRQVEERSHDGVGTIESAC